MKEFIRKVVRKVVMFGVGANLTKTDESIKEIAQKHELIQKQHARLLNEHANSIQYFADTLADKSFLIGCNSDEIRKQIIEIKKIQVQLKELEYQSKESEGCVYQVVPVFKSGDAIGNFALFIKRILDGYGISSEIYCYENLSDLNEIHDMKDFPATCSKDVILLHMAAENEFVEIMEAYSAQKGLFYHNITPSHFFHEFDEFAERSTEKGRVQVELLKSKVDFCITVSEYNKFELQNMGYEVPVHVVPIPFEKKDYDNIESEHVKEKLIDGKKNILFVGRIAPNKKIEDLIEAYQVYYDNYDEDVRLILLGNYNNNDKYYNYLKEKVRSQDYIVFTGHINTEEWITYYKYADVFLCLSEHEGFCVPLVEAMAYQIPIIAYDSSAVGETLGDAGILLRDKKADVVARAIDELFKSDELANAIRKKQRQRMKKFDSKIIAENIKNIVAKVVED